MVVALARQIHFGDVSDTEALRQLRSLAHGAGGLGESLARLAVRVAQGAEFEVARSALHELLARLASARALRLSVEPGDAPGWYRVADCSVWIARALPIEASCECADYRKASLGACIHVLTVLLSNELTVFAHVPREVPALRWDPIRPLSGAGDWIERISDAHRRGSASHEGLVSRRDRREPRAIAIERLVRACQAPRGAEPAIRPLLERELAACVRIEVDEIEHHLRSLKTELFPYQRECVLRFFEHGRLLLGDDMGLGKTAQAIAIAHVLLASGRAGRVLVVCPATLRWQWYQEWLRFSGFVPVMLDGNAAERRRSYASGVPIWIISYEQLRRDRDELVKLQPDLMILDEAQRIKNATTRTANDVKQLAPRWRLALSGTPLENRIDDLASIVEWVDDMALEPRWRLAPWHSMRADGRREIVGMQDLATLRARLAPVFLRRVRAEVLAQLPPRRDIALPVLMTDAQARSHQAFQLLIVELLGKVNRRPLTREELLRLMQLMTEQRLICDALALRKFVEIWPDLRDQAPTHDRLAEVGSPKLESLRDLMQAIAVDQQRRVIVFSQWRRMLQLAEWATRDVLANAGVRGVYFSGHESAQRRIANIVRFHDRPDARVLWATDAGAVGLNLQRAASCCINLDLPWNPAVLEQRIARIYRLGQTEPVEIYNLITVDGIEGRIEQLLGNKRALFQELFDGSSDNIVFASDAANRLAFLRAVANVDG